MDGIRVRVVAVNMFGCGVCGEAEEMEREIPFGLEYSQGER